MWTYVDFFASLTLAYGVTFDGSNIDFFSLAAHKTFQQLSKRPRFYRSRVVVFAVAVLALFSRGSESKRDDRPLNCRGGLLRNSAWS